MATLAAVAICIAYVGAVLLWAGCGPATTSDRDVRYHCAQNLYGVRNDLAAEILFESCVVKYGKIP